MPTEKSIVGSILGCAGGDALGLPYEGLSRSAIKMIKPSYKSPSLVFGRGFVSDDTEHICIVVESLIESGANVENFRKVLARKLRNWILTFPPTVGLATLKATLKLLVGVSPKNSGVFSAGNGPAIRASLLGICFGDNKTLLRLFISASTFITHTDPKAYLGSLTIAVAAYIASQKEITPSEYFEELSFYLADSQTSEFSMLLNQVLTSVESGESLENFTLRLNIYNKVSGYIYHTVPVVLHIWLRNQKNYESAIIEALKCGGDTDTIAAITGSIIGANVGKEQIPQLWLKNIIDRPFSINYMENLGKALIDQTNKREYKLIKRRSFLQNLIRNNCYVFIIFCHLLKRGWWILKNLFLNR